MDKRGLLLLGLLPLVLLPLATIAQADVATPVYAGLDVGGYHMNSNGWDRESAVFGTGVGWQITDATAVELGFNHFVDALDISILGLDANLEVNATTLAVVQRFAWPSDRCRIFAEAGGYYWESDLELKDDSIIGFQMNGDELETVSSDFHYRDKDYGTDGFVGLGLQIRHGSGHLNSRIATRYYHWNHELFDGLRSSSLITLTYDLYWRF
jgi:hypothetical protein